VLGEGRTNRKALQALATAIARIGTGGHLESLIDLIATVVRPDRVTVVRYSTTQRPEFISHRNYSDAMVRKYLDTYYVHDPFYEHWRKTETPGIVPLGSLSRKGSKHGKYIAEFLAESVICDEVGVLLDDGPGWCLGIFFERTKLCFSAAEVARLRTRHGIFKALHDLDIGSRTPGFRRTSQPIAPGRAPRGGSEIAIPSGLWSGLSRRERQLVELILAGHPTAGIARRLGISPGTVKNHRHRIYGKLDITTERELFLQYFEHMSSNRSAP
jgi:DNA-binding CsgD family transcriptional regulator